MLDTNDEAVAIETGDIDKLIEIRDYYRFLADYYADNRAISRCNEYLAKARETEREIERLKNDT